MAMLTIKKIPADLHERLKQQARQNRRSLNSEIIVLLEQALLTPRPQDTDTLIHEIEHFNARLGRTLDHKLISTAKQAGRR